MPKGRPAPSLIALLLLGGCGGSGGSHRPPAAKTVAPRVTIAWPARSRDVNAPGSALSAAVVLQRANADGTDLAFQVDRPASAAAVVQTYTAPSEVKGQTTALLIVNFHAQADAMGDLVGTASAQVSVAADGSLTHPDGTTLGTVDFTGTVQSVSVAAPASLSKGTTVDLAVTANSATGIVAVSPGSIMLSVTSGTDVLRAEGGVTVTALEDGVATIVATIDGKASAPTTVTVATPALAARTLTVVTNKLVYDAQRARIWAALPRYGEGLGDSIVAIDPATGMLSTPIAVGSNPTAMAISDDDSTMYVGLAGANAVRRVDLASATAGLQFALTIPPPISAQAYALDLAVMPGNPSTVAVTLASRQGGTYGPAIYDDGVKRPIDLGAYVGTRIAFASPSRLFATDYGGSPTSLYDYSIGPQGPVLQQRLNGAIKVFAYGVVPDGARVYVDEGSVFDSVSLTKIGDFLPKYTQASAGSFYGPAIDDAKGRAYFVGVVNGAVKLHIFDTATFAEVASIPITGIDPSIEQYSRDSGDLIRWSGSGLAFRTTDRVVFLDNVPVG